MLSDGFIPGAIKGTIRSFLDWNRTMSRKIDSRFRRGHPDLFSLYEQAVEKQLSSGACQFVVDVGGGKSCPFAKGARQGSQAKIIAVDVARQELETNEDVGMKLVADVTKAIPLKDRCVDLIASRSVLEHLRDLSSFILESKRVLREGGLMIHMFPSKRAPFAVLNRLLPGWLGRFALSLFIPETRGICGFPAVYDRCGYPEIVRLIGEHRMELVSLDVSYYQSNYYYFCLPLFLLSSLYDAAARKIGNRKFCTYLVVVAKKA